MKKLIFLSLLLTLGNVYSQDLNITTGTNLRNIITQTHQEKKTQI